MKQNQNPKVQPWWFEKKKTDEDYFTAVEKRRNLWFDFFCINPINKQIPKLNYASKSNNRKPTQPTDTIA
jgi:hypothetical protein